MAHLIIDGLWRDDLADFVDEGRALRAVKDVLSEVIAKYQEIDNNVRQIIAKMSRPIPEGSPQWEMTYRKLYQQELLKAWK